MISQRNAVAEAERLDAAERGRQQIRPTATRYPDLTMDDAYAIQSAWMDLKRDRGREVIGYKIGLTSRAMQIAMKIDEPDYGVLLDDMLFETGVTLPANDFLDPRIEVELAFVLKDRLEGADVTVDEVIAATDYVVPALELIAARTHRVDPETSQARGIVDTISDNAANAGVITGGRKVAPDEVDLRWVGAMLSRNGSIEETGLAAAVLDHPANGIAWVARRFAPHGVALEAGQLILAGSFTRPVVVRSGDVFEADYGDLGVINCQFS